MVTKKVSSPTKLCQLLQLVSETSVTMPVCLLIHDGDETVDWDLEANQGRLDHHDLVDIYSGWGTSGAH